MANRRHQGPRQKFPSKPKEIAVNINVWTDRLPLSRDGNRNRLEDFKHILGRAHNFRVDTAHEPANTENARNMKITLKTTEYSKARFFENLRRDWCRSICSSGDPFWLESAENSRDTFKYKFEDTRQVLQATSFSLGSFYDRGTYIKHWSSEDNASLIEDGNIQIEFEHDTKILAITYFKSGMPEGFKEVRIEMEYRQLENYVVTDENTTRGTINFYFPLQWPPKVFEEVQVKDHTNYNRLTSFLGCRREILGNSSVLCLSFRLDHGQNVADSPLEVMACLSQRGFSFFFGAVKTKSPRGPTEIPLKPEFSDYKITYALECLLSRGYKIRDRISRRFYDLLRKATDRYESLLDNKLVSVERVCNTLYRLVGFVETDRFCPLEVYLERLLYGDMKHLTAFEFELPKHYVYVPRLVITPTQNFLVPPELVAENRVIRDFGHKEGMRIAFREEDFSKLASTYPEGLQHVLRERVVDLLSQHIEIGGREFEFLACSNSQLRDHGAWLYANNGEHRAADIRGSLGQLNEIRCVATYVSRMGQCFSSTKEAVTVSIEAGCRVKQIPDVEKPYNNVYFKCCGNWRSGTYTFSDGVGKISRALARKVADSLDLDPIPSAYQIRYRGCKGMLAIDPSLTRGDVEEILQYRKSMKKFDSSHSALEICEATKPNRLYLNRQCIILLNGLGVPDETFISLQDKMLRSLALMLLFETVALDTLRQANIPGGLKVTALSRSGVNVTREPFFRSLLLAIYKSRLGDLLRRARIAIPETHGRLLMGVVDETGSLEYGQVFVRYSKSVSEPGKELKTLEGKVVISKNPCFHPGDMRTFEAVDVKVLHHLVDCIVFPAKGHRPHPDEMSGSDLDGDKYFVTWYDKLIPPRENEEPMDFTAPEKIVLRRPVEVSDMIQFVSDYIKNDQLGIIANAHLVHADHDEDGIFSSECIKLAHMHSDAVDFPKTGKCPSLPRELRPDQYPDFMMKPGKPRYNSQRILGKLFRKCQSLDRAQRFSDEASQTQITADQDMIVPGYEQYLEEAKAVRNHYNTKLEGLMSLYGLKHEGEVITGCLVRVNTRLSAKTDEKFEVAQMIQASLATLRSKTRHDFYDEFGGEEAVMEELEENGTFSDEVLKKASAWYLATYGDQDEEENLAEEQMAGSSSTLQSEHQAGDKKGKVRLISFPWVVDRILAKIKDAKQKERKAKGVHQQHTLNAVGDLITDQAAYFFESFLSNVIDDREMRIEERNKLQSILNRLLEGKHVPRLSLCGASLTGISVGDESQEQQHIEIYAHFKWNATEHEQYQHLHSLSRSLSRAGDVHIYKGYPPMLRFQRSQGLLRQQYYITAGSNEMLRSAYVGLHVQWCPRLLHLLLIVMHWGRRRRINGVSRGCFLTDEELATLFVAFCEKSEFINELKIDELQGFASRLLGLPSSAQQTEAENLWNREVLGEGDRGQLKGFKNDTTPGHVLIKFFEYYSTPGEDDPLHVRSMKNPVKISERLCPNVSVEESGRFSDAALHAFHELAQCCGLDSLTASTNAERTRELKETLNMPNATWGALRFAEEFVRVKLSNMTSSQITIRPAQRSAGYILEATGNYLTLHGVQKELENLESTCQSYIYDHNVSGGTRFLFLNQSSPEDRVTFKTLKKGDSAVNIANNALLFGLSSGDGLAETKFCSTLSSQLKVFQREHLLYMHGADTLTIKAEFGSIYVENVQFPLPSSVAEVEKTLSENADPKNQSGQGNRQRKMRHKFIPFSGRAGGWSAAFPTAILQSSKETYTLGIKAGKNHTQTVVYDENLNLCDVEIPPINWVVTDVKAPRAVNARSRDTDFRITVCSERKLETEAEKEEIMSSGKYERCKSAIRKQANGGAGLELTHELQKKVTFVRHDKTSVYDVSGNNDFFIQVKDVQKYDVKGSRFLNSPKTFTEVQICGAFSGKNEDAAMIVAKEVWAAAKKVRPHITS